MSNKKATVALAIVAVVSLLIILLYFIVFKGLFEKPDNYLPSFIEVDVADQCADITWNPLAEGKTMKLLKKVGAGEFIELATLTSDMRKYTDNDILFGESYSYRLDYTPGKRAKNPEPGQDQGITEVSFKAEDFKAPKLVSLSSYDAKEGKTCGKLTFKSEAGKPYNILRKGEDGEFKVVGMVTAEGEETSFSDKTMPDIGEFVYTARQCATPTDKIINVMGQCDKDGIATLNFRTENVVLDANNLNAKVSWSPVQGKDIDGYLILRKVFKDGSYRIIEDVDEDETSYTDVYLSSLETKKEKKHSLVNCHFVDPSYNPLVYTVRAYKEKDGKKSYSRYPVDGDFRRTTPSITYIKEGEGEDNSLEIQWSTVPNATKYIICSGVKGETEITWTQEKEVPAETPIKQSTTMQKAKEGTYYTVKAAFDKNGEEVYSDFDQGFDIGKRKYSNNNILFLGDSITFGSPYRSEETCNIFSYPYRVNQLTNVKYYNPSIPGSTYSWRWMQDASGNYVKNNARYRLSRDVAERIKKGIDVERPYPFATPENTQKFEDFDVVLLAAGTNDYLDCRPMAPNINSTDVDTFNGAFNQIMQWIEEGSEKRIAQGKNPTKVIFVDLFYSDRLGAKFYGEKHNRFISQNRLGLTLTDYQDMINKYYDMYSSGHNLELYRFETSSYINEETCPYNASDNLHMTRIVYDYIGNGLTDFLIDNKIITE